MAFTESTVPCVENHLIESLPRKDRQGLLKVCQEVELSPSEVLLEPETPARQVYFPVVGFVSLMQQVDVDHGVEVGMVGREGMLGAHLAQGVSSSPLHALVQGGGSAHRVGAKAFLSFLAMSQPLQRVLNRYLYVLMMQSTISVACQRYHSTAQRLARRLLMCEDRTEADSFHVTQECLASMLGVQRVGVTTAAGALQRSGLIRYRRGEIMVLDRAGLERAACSCYRRDLRAYAALL